MGKDRHANQSRLETLVGLRVLHVGWGFTPWRAGGLINYAEDLMAYQSRQDWQVAYFCSGRHYPFRRNPVCNEWYRGKVRVYELVNSNIIHGGDAGTIFPLKDLSDDFSEEIFRRTLRSFCPDLIHFHELAGLPSSLIDIAKLEFKLPTLMSLADYFLLCPTLKLFDYRGEHCHDFAFGEKCTKCCFLAPRSRRSLLFSTLAAPFKGLVKRAPQKFLAALDACLKTYRLVDPPADAATSGDFKMRRDTNLARLDRLDRLLPRSEKVAEIYGSYLNGGKLSVLNPMLQHIEKIRPEPMTEIPDIIKFVTLNGFSSVQKGSNMFLEAISLLKQRGFSSTFEVHVFGGVVAGMSSQLAQCTEICCHGPYPKGRLDQLLSGMHVGVVPSVWEEVYGYVGPEMLAKGIPVIGNRVGGITEYVIDGETGFLNRDCSAAGLADLMQKVIQEPEVLLGLNKKICLDRSRFCYKEHFAEIKNLYWRTINEAKSER